jgi:mannosyl-oligosaccharide glucosidase
MHVLTSGMDDYPRGPPHAGELHLDLISWMGFFTRTMREIAEFVGETEDESNFRDIEKAIVDNIDGEDYIWTTCET